MRVRADDPQRPWHEPGVYAVAPGVHRIPLPLPGDALRGVNVYAVELPVGVLLVDAGQVRSGAEEQLEQALEALGRGLADVRRVLVTHVHRDHYTLAVGLRRRTGVPVALGAGEKPSLEVAHTDAFALAPQVAALRPCGAAERTRSSPRFPGCPDATACLPTSGRFRTPGSPTARRFPPGRAPCAGGPTWTRRERRLAELDPFNQMLAVLETAAHLDVLVLQGVLVVEERDGIAGYREF